MSGAGVVQIIPAPRGDPWGMGGGLTPLPGRHADRSRAGDTQSSAHDGSRRLATLGKRPRKSRPLGAVPDRALLTVANPTILM